MKRKEKKKIFISQLFGTHATLRKIQVATVTIDCIQLRQGIWELPRGKRMDIYIIYGKLL